MDTNNENADVLIVGGGSAGAVLAARLSEDPGRSVVLIEAGVAYPPSAYPQTLQDAARVGDPGHDWGYTPTPTTLSRRRQHLVAKCSVGARR